VAADLLAGAGRERDLELVGVTKRFGEVVAVDELSLTMPGGSFFALLGPSGCGKTTMLRMIAGLLPPSQGSIQIGGEALWGPNGPRTVEASTGMVFQDANLFPWRTVIENIEFPLVSGRARWNRERARGHAVDLCARVGLAGFEDRLPKELSGGMRQRVALARAISTSPQILLMDEPFGALDAFTRDKLNIDLQDLWLATGLTAVLVTHSISEAVFLADRVILFSARPGRVIATVAVELPRPRTLDIQASQEFQQLVLSLRHQLESA
jgi:NitT/TauT family transport system ATP-binding protein